MSTYYLNRLLVKVSPVPDQDNMKCVDFGSGVTLNVDLELFGRLCTPTGEPEIVQGGIKEENRKEM